MFNDNPYQNKLFSEELLSTTFKVGQETLLKTPNHSVEENCINDKSVLVFFLKGPTPASFCLFLFFTNINFTEKTVGFSGIRTRIVG